MSFTFLITTLAPELACAATYRMFVNGSQVPEYNEIIKTFKASKRPFSEPTYLVFDNLPPIEIVSFLGNGGLTAVFRRADGRALRIPLASGDAFFHNGPNGELKNNGPYTKGMTSFLSAMQKLAAASALIPKIFEAGSHAPEYITVEYFNAKFNIRDFFLKRDELIANRVLTLDQAQDLEVALKRFVLRVAAYKYIGDFKVEQVMTNGKSWRLLDGADPVQLATEVTDPTPFDHRNMGPKLPPEVWTWITETIRTERATNPTTLRVGREASGSVRLCKGIHWH